MNPKLELKLQALPSRRLADWIRSHPGVVADIDYGDGFCTESGYAYDVLIEPGMSISYHGDNMHTIIEPTAAEVLQILRTAAPCDCPGECHAAHVATGGTH